MNKSQPIPEALPTPTTPTAAVSIDCPPRRRKQRGRTAISKSLRFEVFKRDSFTCQYCGEKAPHVVLHVDHVIAVAKGGTNSILNLITACEDCNSGKSDRPLDEHSALARQQRQLEQMQVRREQLVLMMQWQQELLDLEKAATEQTAQYWAQLVPFTLNANGTQELQKLLRKYGLDLVLECMRISASQYTEIVDGTPTHASVERAWNYVGRIANVKRLEAEEPYLKDLFYVRAIVRRRVQNVVAHKALAILKEAYLAGVPINALKDIARSASSWSRWQEDMRACMTET